MNSEIKSIEQMRDDEICQRCREHPDSMLCLECEHTFCLTCIAFMHVKFQKQLKNSLLIKCLLCNKISEIGDTEYQLIKEEIQKNILPFLASEEKQFTTEAKQSLSKISKSGEFLREVDVTVDKKLMKSQQHSMEKITPSNKYFFSKCESPKSTIVCREYCSMHTLDEISFICFTCENLLLCLKCITSKKHNSHDIKGIPKSIETMNEQITLNKMDAKDQIENLQMLRRRLDDRKNIIKDRSDKISKQIRQGFVEMIHKINKKCQSVVSSCELHFHKLIEDVEMDRDRIQQNIQILRRHNEKLNQMIKNNHSPSQFVKKTTQIMKQIDIKLLGEIQVNLMDKIPYPSSSIFKEISQVSDFVQNLQIQYKMLNISKTVTMCIENSRSEEKFAKDNFAKRIKTNMVSLNSSRDKKDKKCTKTEEDQRRNKSKANYKTQSASKLVKANKEIPQYIMQFLEKPAIKPFQAGMQVYTDTLQNSFKSASKVLSKSHVPVQEDFERKKKKDHAAMIKERLERKTVTPNQNLKEPKVSSQAIKKKKIAF